MAITLADFDKIWASTSPLTPYSFSEANYKRGWNFIGSTPPARQMWDSYMKASDEKHQWLYNNKLSLSGGTMTGAIVSTANKFVRRSNDTGYLQLMGGTEFAYGASLTLLGQDSTQPGQFMLRARDASTYKDLLGKPDGTLSWGAQPILYGPTASFANNGYFTIQHRNTAIQWRRENIGAGASYTWTFPRPFGADNQYTRFVSSKNDCTVTTTATTMTVTNNGSTTAEVNMLAIGLMAQ